MRRRTFLRDIDDVGGGASWRLWKDVPMFTGVGSLSGMGETSMIGFLLALLIGVVAGLRAMTAPAVISWATNLGWLHVGATSLAFLDYSWVRWILTVLALGELVTDQLPSTPSRSAPAQDNRTALALWERSAALAGQNAYVLRM